MYAFSTENWLRSDEEVEYLMFFNRDFSLGEEMNLIKKVSGLDF
ncbi:MAG: hypothetical protein Ct9H90mP17_4690 [Actinomycetota bacterium]|nr:MAG: hypothetical protein Ct9H90mP17_4690 [Actinomycetota bacterium]